MKSLNDFPNVEEYNEYLRVVFAGMAMQGMLSNPNLMELLEKVPIDHAEYLSIAAIEQGESLLTELNKKQ